MDNIRDAFGFRFSPSFLENWMNTHYSRCDFNLGSSGTASYSMGELIEMIKLDYREIDKIKFNDSNIQGGLQLRKMIARRWGDGDASKVMCFNGAGDAIFHVTMTLMSEGDEVVLLDPLYHSLSKTAELKKCKVRKWKLRSENNYMPDLDELHELLTPNTRFVIVNFPHNPLGVTVSPDMQQRMIEIIRKFNCYLIWDDAFGDMVNGTPLPNPHLVYDKAITIGTLSKSCGLPGLRIGWVLANEHVVDSCLSLKKSINSFISPLQEYLATNAILCFDILSEKKLRETLTNKCYLKEWITTNEDLVSWVEPAAGACATIHFKQVDDHVKFCEQLVEREKVMLVPGRSFNMEDCVRLGFGESNKVFKVGLNKLNDFLKSY